MELNMGINVDLEDIVEIERNYDKLGEFLTSNFCSFPACAFVLQTVMNEVDKVKKKLEEG